MTVQDLIDILNKVENKSLNVIVECYDSIDDYHTKDALIVYSLSDEPIGIIISNDSENRQQDTDRNVYGVSILKGFKTCINFKPRKEAQP